MHHLASRRNVLKAKYDDGKVNREEIRKSREESSPRAKPWLWDSAKKEEQA